MTRGSKQSLDLIGQAVSEEKKFEYNGHLHVRGMIKNNVDFCYKKLYSQHRLTQTIPLCFGNCLGSENKIFVLILFIPLVHGLFLLPWLRAPGAVQ